MLTDFKYALRSLGKAPGFSLAVIATLALGIASTASVFSVFDGVLLQPLGYTAPDRLVRLLNVSTSISARRTSTISYPDFVDAESQSGAFSVATYSAQWHPSVSGYGNAEILTGGAIDSHFFETFGVKPERGRFFIAKEDQPGSDDKVVISHGLWMRKFGGSDVVGKPLHVDGRVLTVVGIAPAFEDPRLNDPRDSEIWTTLAPLPGDWSRDGRSLAAVARLRDGVTLANARARISAVASRLRTQYVADRETDVIIVPLRDTVVGSVERPLGILLGAAALLLLVACVNVVNLMLARTSRRSAEISVRVALGASPRHLLRRLFAEAMVLAIAGGATGVALAFGIVRLFAQLAAVSIPRFGEVSINGRVLIFAIAVTLLVAIVTAILPALQSIWGGIAAPGSVRGAAGSGRAQRAQTTLVIAQVAISVVVIAVAALLGRSLWNLLQVDKGIDERGVLTMQVRAPREKYAGRREFNDFYRDVTAKIAAIPGVAAVGTTSILPLDGDWSCDGFSLQQDPAARSVGCAEARVISTGYLTAIGSHLVRGRPFGEHDVDHAPLVTIIDQTFASRYFNNDNPIGRQIRIHQQLRTIVGIAGAARLMNADEPAGPAVYMPEMQDERSGRERSVIIRTATDPSAMIPAAREAIAAVSREAPVMNVRTMSEVLAGSLAPQRFRALLVGGFGAAALLLATVGIAGVLAFATSQRTREIGIRLALGSTPMGIVRIVLRRALQLIAMGSIVGLAGALAAGRFVRTLLFGVPANDPLTLGLVVAILAFAALIAAALPAARAANIEPMDVLRAD